MKRLFLLFTIFFSSISSADVNNAYKYLYDVMDQYHKTFDLYTDQDSGGNHFYPSGWMGDLRVVSIDTNWQQDVHSGTSSIKIAFSPNYNTWSGIYWQDPQNNWGNVANAGYDLSGATKLTFWARGEKGGERVEFFAGGIAGRYPDSFSKASTGYVTLDSNWRKYLIDLTSLDLGHVIGGFGFVTNTPNNPNGAIFYLDDIQYDKPRPDDMRFLASFKTLHGNDPDQKIKNTAFIYDNALALIAFLTRGTPEDLRRAKILADSFIYAQENDRYFTDGRLRNAYASGDITLFHRTDVKLPGWWDFSKGMWNEDVQQVSTYSGNIAWAIIALCSYYEKAGGEKYLDAAERLATWIDMNAKGRGNGYAGGYQGWEKNQNAITWESTLDNINIYAAFRKLYGLTKDPVWEQRANYAKQFVQSMQMPSSQIFWTGTLDDSTTINKSVIPLDVQAALNLTIGEYPLGLASLNSSHYLTADGFEGFDANSDLDGIWFEGTARIALAYQMNADPKNASRYIDGLSNLQQQLGENGIVAASRDNVSSGFLIDYYKRAHVGTTAWYIFAKNGVNPYFGTSSKKDLYREYDLINHLVVHRFYDGKQVYENQTQGKLNCTGATSNVCGWINDHHAHVIEFTSDREFVADGMVFYGRLDDDQDEHMVIRLNNDSDVIWVEPSVKLGGNDRWAQFMVPGSFSVKAGVNKLQLFTKNFPSITSTDGSIHFEPEDGARSYFAFYTTDGDADDDGLSDAGTDGEDNNSDGLIDPDDSNETNPFKADTDEDGSNDGEEVAQGTDPNDPKSTPGLGPKVISISPEDKALDVNSFSLIEIVFNEPVTIDSNFENEIVYQSDKLPLPMEMTLSTDKMIMTLKPKGILIPKTSFSIRIAKGIRNQDGYFVAPFRSVFYTRGDGNYTEPGLDSDNDSLTDEQEYIYGSNPNVIDSDNDGTSDGAEVAQGGSPTDSSDGGKTPSSEDVVKFRLTIGDSSGSHSERYSLKVGSITYPGVGIGEVGTSEIFTLPRGKSYDITIVHTATDYSEEVKFPDYDYEAGVEIVEGDEAVYVVDPEGILGVISDDTALDEKGEFYASGKSAKLYALKGELSDVSPAVCKEGCAADAAKAIKFVVKGSDQLNNKFVVFSIKDFDADNDAEGKLKSSSGIFDTNQLEVPLKHAGGETWEAGAYFKGTRIGYILISAHLKDISAVYDAGHTKVECCYVDSGVIKFTPNSPITDLDKCPNRKPNGEPPIINGCTGVPNNPNVDIPLGDCPFADTINRPSFKPACDQHDECYDTCGKTKEYCDKKFEEELLAICSDVPDIGCQHACISNAVKYGTVVSSWPSLAIYEPSQKRVCNCCQGIDE